MSLKTLLVCVQALLIQNISGQCIGAAPFLATPCAAPLVAGPCALGVGPVGLAASHGPGVAVTTASPLIPAGVSVLSEIVYEGVLGAGGALPFLGTVALEGALPTAGAGAIAYGCGSGVVGITAKDIRAIAVASPLGLAGPIDIAGPLGVAGPIGIVGPVGIAGPIGVARPLGTAGLGCGCGLIL